LPLEKVEAIADGRIFSGEQALALGLVDKLGNLEDTIELAAKMAGIKGKPHVVYARKRRPSIFDYFIDEVVQRLRQKAQDIHPHLNYIWYR
ncbi:MAG: signal peptide peptidase SppA, partial [Deltaproteobacteria bacterium]